MTLYRRIPTTIEAHQFTDPLNPPPGVQYQTIDYGTDEERGYFYVVTIHHQKTPIRLGDWILPEGDGIHFYPCKPDIFESTYEEVED